MTSITRRSFVKHTSTALAGLSMACATGKSRIIGANDRLNVATVGLRNMGWSDTKQLMRTGQVNIVGLCDVDSEILAEKAEAVGEEQGRKPKTYSDFRKLLDDREVDAVVVATPDHWHGIIAIRACQAGKHVYVEKPCAHNVHECRMIAEAAKRYNRVVQHGTQQRSGTHFQRAKEYVQSGKLGKIGMVRTWAILGRGSIGKKPATDPPAHIDYDRWLGPATKRPYTENRCHYNWRFMWDYGTGDMGNWGVHWLDIALWSMNLGWPQAVSSSGGIYIYDDDKETPDTQLATYEYPNLTLVWELRMWSRRGVEGRGTGTGFYGDQQTLIVNRGGYQVYGKDNQELIEEVKKSNDSDLDHKLDFIDSIRNNRSPIADISSGQISAGVAILGNVAFLAGEKIRYTPGDDSLVNRSKNHLLTREYRNKWKLPSI